MIEHGLWESLASGIRSQIGDETERLVDGEVGLDVVERSARTLGLLEDVTTSPGEHTVDTTHGLLGHLDLDEVDWLEDGRLGQEHGGVEDTTGSWDDLATATMDSISVESDILDVEAS